jgi:hypothetical protein
MSVMKELLIASRLTLPAKKSLLSWYMSSLMICQHFLKNMPLKPSGPGALSMGICLTTLSISSLVNGADTTKKVSLRQAGRRWRWI